MNYVFAVKNYFRVCMVAASAACCFTTCAYAAPAVEINQANIRVDLAPYVDILEDADGSISFKDIQNNTYAHKFTPAPLTDLFFGYTRSVYWLRFSVENQLDAEKPLILEITPADLDYIEIFGLDKQSNELLFYKLSGSAVDFKDRDYNHPLYYFDLMMPAKSNRLFYVRLESNKTINAQLKLSSPREHFFYAGMRDWWQGFLFGALLFLGALHLIFGAAFRFKGFTYCGLWLLSMTLIQGSWNGYYVQFLKTDIDLLDRQLMTSVYLSVVFGLLFIRTYLDTHRRTPRAHRVLTFFMMISLMGIPCAWLLSPTFNSMVVGLIATPITFFMFGLGIYSFLEGYEPARYFLLARTITIVMILVALFADRGLLPDAFVITYGLAASIAFEGAVFLFAMTEYQFKRREHHLGHSALVSNLGGQVGVPVSVFCHELRTPISGVLGMTELLLDTNLSSQQRVQAESIQSSGKSLLDVVNKMSDLSSIEKGELELRDGAFEMITLVELCVESARALSEQRHIELLYQVDESVSGWVYGDRDRLQQVLAHLITFSARQLEAGEILLSVRSTASQATRFEITAGRHTLNQARHAALNNLEADILSADNLNLTVARQFVALMGGELLIDRMDDGGVQINFQLQLRRQRVADVVESADKTLLGKSLMIVDDNDTCCKIIQQQAARWGMDAISALSGKIALAELRSRADLKRGFDILLIDYEMPGMNGMELLQRLEQEWDALALHDTRIFILTGASKMPNQLLDQHPKVVRVLYKPLSGKNLKLVLAEALLAAS